MVAMRSAQATRAASFRRAAALSGVFLALACSEPRGSTGRPETAGDADGETLERARVRSAFVAARQREGERDARYHIERGRSAGVPTSEPLRVGAVGRLIARNPVQGFVTTFGEGGVTTEPASGDWKLGMRVRDIVCGDKLLPVEARGGPAPSEANQVEYERRAGGFGFREWYVNGPLGLEQGVTLGSSPCGENEELRLVVEVEGFSARAASRRNADGSAGIELVDENGAVRLGYSDLYVEDATDRALPARMEPAPGGAAVDIAVSTAGAKYPLRVDPLVWGERPKLVASDRAADEFGISVSLTADRALVGAQLDDSVRGAAYVYLRSGASWREEQKLTASDRAEWDHFGSSVSLTADRALVGAHGLYGSPGAAYVFVRNGTSWTEERKLTASDGAADDYFGGSVSLTPDRALVGAIADDARRGSAYVFVRNGTSWTEEKKLTATDGAMNDQFGGSVALTADRALVGANRDDSDRGSAYVFVRNGTSWAEEQKLTAADGVADDNFGIFVSLTADRALVGADRDDLQQGSAYVFFRSGTTWTEEEKLTASDGAAYEQFGASLSLTADRALVSAYRFNSIQGAAYVFLRNGTSWAEEQKLIASDGAFFEYFGWAVSLAGNRALIGAAHDDEGRGSAYPFVLGLENGDACAVDADCVSGYCVDGRCCNIDCTGACGACSVAEGADTDGVCKVAAAGSPGSPACAPRTCIGTSVACADCAQDSECPNGTYCSADGTCQTQKELGDSCNLAQGADCREASCRACPTPHCTDGVCCDAACRGACEACTNALTGVEDGTCSPIPENEDPNEECEADPAGSCDRPGSCSGSGECLAYAVDGTPCGETTCTNGSVTGQLCNGVGRCGDDSAACAPYVCEGDACGTTCDDDVGCALDAFCDTRGRCQPKLGPGEPCTRVGECGTAAPRCTDGVCCESACAGQCEACDVERSEGSCVPVEGEPHGDREACGGNGVCAGSCDGSEGATCAYPGESTECASECTDSRETVSRCDGAGACAAGRGVSCGDYACGADRCLTSCESSPDCAAGRRCESGDCIPSTASCSEGLGESRPANGDPIPCGAYLCDPTTGACRTTCNLSADCSAGFACNPDTKSCEAAGKPSGDDDGGCGCRVGSRQAAGSLAAWMLVLGGLAAQRRRRRARRS